MAQRAERSDLRAPSADELKRLRERIDEGEFRAGMDALARLLRDARPAQVPANGRGRDDDPG
jgi:hypothetical protein